MAGRSLGPDEEALWRRVTADVRPIGGRRRARPIVVEPLAAKPVAAPPIPPRPMIAKPAPANTLDGGWDRRLKRGVIVPDFAIDLHGHTLASAHAELDAGLARAIATDVRVLLLVTGKPPRADRGGRGAIRGEVLHWLQFSRHARDIAAIRNAHPRHGGQGALYIILKRAARRG